MPGTIAVLAVQGAFIEHEQMLARLGHKCIELRQASDLERPFDRLVLPGGESTTQGKLLAELGMLGPLRRRIEEGMPVLATCAGLILLAERLAAHDDKGTPRLATMDVEVERNAYGRQLGSFHATLSIPGLSADPVACVFIRAPWVERVWGAVKVLAEENGHIIAARQDHMLVTSFHPELTDDTAVHSAFAAMC